MKNSAPGHIVFSDFDGTICQSDATTILIDRCIGTETRKALDQDMLNGRKGFREAVGFMWNNVNLSRAESEELLQAVQVDSGFVEFVKYCRERGIPIVILSSGLTWIVALCIERFLGADARAITRIVANDMHISDDNKWTITWVDDSSHGHDKALSIRKILAEYVQEHPDQPKPVTYYIGDGVSDISAASQCDHLYAKEGLDFEQWCRRNQVPFVNWKTFDDVRSSIAEKVLQSP